MAEVDQILIVGGGIAGLSLARIAAKAWILPPAQRDAALRERGDQMLRDRYRPLIAAP